MAFDRLTRRAFLAAGGYMALSASPVWARRSRRLRRRAAADMTVYDRTTIYGGATIYG